MFLKLQTSTTDQLEMKNSSLFSFRTTLHFLKVSYYFIVPQHGVSVHADLQSYMHDATHRSLVRMFAIFGAYVTGVSVQLLGCY